MKEAKHIHTTGGMCGTRRERFNVSSDVYISRVRSATSDGEICRLFSWGRPPLPPAPCPCAHIDHPLRNTLCRMFGVLPCAIARPRPSLSLSLYSTPDCRHCVPPSSWPFFFKSPNSSSMGYNSSTAFCPPRALCSRRINMQAMRNRLSFWLFDDTGTVFFCFFVFHQLNPHLLHSNKILKKGEKKLDFKNLEHF